jgi:hypothetical protein
MRVRTPRKESGATKPRRGTTAKKAAAADRAAVKREKPAAPVSPEKKRPAAKKRAAAKPETSAPRKVSSRAKTKKATAKTAGKNLRGKGAEPSREKEIKKTKGASPAKVRKTAAASPVAYGKKTAGKKKVSKTETPVREAKRPAKRETSSKIAGRPARRKISSLKTHALEKVKWEDRERFPELPKEYGEDDLLLMAVDPGTVYAAWEITKDRLPGGKGDLALRLVDVAGGGASRDIRVGESVGSGFFEIRMSGADVVAEIGLLSAQGEFMPILRSPVVSFPSLPAFDELGIFRKLFESGIRAGY